MEKRLPKTAREIIIETSLPPFDYKQGCKMCEDYILQDDDESRQQERVEELMTASEEVGKYINKLSHRCEYTYAKRSIMGDRDLSEYSEEVQEIFDYWQGLGIVKYAKSKFRTETLNLLSQALERYSKEDIIRSMDNHKRLLSNPYAKSKAHYPPFKVTLNQFFKFDLFTDIREETLIIKEHVPTRLEYYPSDNELEDLVVPIGYWIGDDENHTPVCFAYSKDLERCLEHHEDPEADLKWNLEVAANIAKTYYEAYQILFSIAMGEYKVPFVLSSWKGRDFDHLDSWSQDVFLLVKEACDENCCIDRF